MAAKLPGAGFGFCLGNMGVVGAVMRAAEPGRAEPSRAASGSSALLLLVSWLN